MPETLKAEAPPVRGISRPPLDRMRVIAQRIISGEGFNCLILAGELEVTPMTIFRDVEFMRDRLGYEIEWDVPSNRYYGRAPKERIL